MTASAYHLFYDIYQRRRNLRSETLDAENFMLRDSLIACRGSKGIFPDLILQTNQDNPVFAGGELIEIKDSQSYAIASFNSTIPSAYKDVRDYVKPTGRLFKEIQKNTNTDPHLCPRREVYYLLRGRKQSNCKVCLVHGAFFETLNVQENIKSALNESFTEAMAASGLDGNAAAQQAADKVLGFNWQQNHLAKTRKHQQSSISIRMRVMSEVVNEANIFNEKQYSQIKDNTLAMIVPAPLANNYKKSENSVVKKMRIAFECGTNPLPNDITVSRLDHLKDGTFILFHTPII